MYQVYPGVGRLRNSCMSPSPEMPKDASDTGAREVDLVSAAAAIAHDLASPLAAIQGGLCVLRKLVTDPIAFETMEAMQVSLNQLLESRCRILDLYEHGDKRSHSEPVLVELTELCNQLISTLPPPVRSRTLEVPRILNAMVRCRPVLLHQVLRNLIENAAKYSFPDSPISVRVEVSHSRVFLSVSNQGIGIPPGEKDNLFHPFVRCSNAVGIEGRGIGLSIVQMNVRKMGGTISLKSEMGGETRFTVSLPLTLWDNGSTGGFTFQRPGPRVTASIA